MAALSNAMHFFRVVLRLLGLANFLFAAFVAVILLASLAAPYQLAAMLGAPNAGPSIIAAFRLFAIIGLLSVPLAFIILRALISVIDTVQAGDPFVADNARRLTTMAWALLGLEVLHLGSIVVAVGASADGQQLKWSFSFTGWLAVMLLFTLARVFEHGTRMRSDLEGTV